MSDKIKHHKANGPAMHWSNGEWLWLLYNKVHRYYGPAYKNEWWLYDNLINDND